MLELASRGYLKRIDAELPPCGPGPVITDIVGLSPTIAGVADTSPPGPTITGQITQAPSISRGSSEQVVSPLDPPTISGGGPLIPGVDSEED